MRGLSTWNIRVLLMLSILAIFSTECSQENPASGVDASITDGEARDGADGSMPDGSTSDADNTVVPKGERLLGIDILNETEQGSFEDNIQIAHDVGAEFTGLHLSWSQIETGPQTYVDPWDALGGLGAVCSQNNMKLSLTIRPIDITGKTVPEDLNQTSFNADVMQIRFQKLLDFVFTKIDYHLLTSLQVGNEIDGYDVSNENPAFWSDYADFLGSIKTYVDDHYTGLKIGFTVTLLGVTTGQYANSGIFESLSDVVDLVGVTYYPLNQDFTVMDPGVVEGHFAAITTAFAGKTIFLQEVGYQTSATCNSSAAKQARFVENVFFAWDMHKDQIKLVEFVRLNNVSRSEAEDMAGPYGIGDEGFIEYLRTLGLRTFDGSGTDKEGLSVLKAKAHERGWGSSR